MNARSRSAPGATSAVDKPPRRGKRRIRYAVIGQGYISQDAVLPAFAHAQSNSELAALISDDPVKLKKLSRTYGVALTGGYDDYDALLRSGEVDAVYIALPNHLHRDYSVRAARAGIHVLCEKPMAVTETECRQMIRECETHHVKLMIAYRLHFEKANLTAIDIAQSGRLGNLRLFTSVFTMQVRDENNIRLRAETGGGTLYDIGVYCINAARYLFRAEPLEVFAVSARNDEPRFDAVEEMTSAVLRFPDDRLATFICSFGAARSSSYDLFGDVGHLRVSPAFGTAEELKHVLTVNDKSRERVFPKRDQFAPELIYFSNCILKDREPEPSGAEGLIDVRIINALYESIETGRPVALQRLEKQTRPSPSQEVSRPPVAKPELVRAAGPSGKR